MTECQSGCVFFYHEVKPPQCLRVYAKIFGIKEEITEPRFHETKIQIRRKQTSRCNKQNVEIGSHQLPDTEDR